MAQNMKFGAGLALVTVLVGMAVSNIAMAMPEMIVGSHVASASAQTQAPTADSADVAGDAEVDSVAADNDTESVSN